MRVRIQQTIIISVLILLLCSPAFSADIPAFPGAQGSAAFASGGRGGTVYKVTTLADSGPGSFRDAVSGSNRIIVFEVSGWIDLSSNIYSKVDNITIAGQTSPGGIGVRGGSLIINGGQNWIITHMRFANPSFHEDSLVIWGPDADNIMVDHCSIRYACDECVDISYDAQKVTFSWCIIGPGAGDKDDACHEKGKHNYGFLLWDDGSSGHTELTIHHSYFPHNSRRNPWIQGRSWPLQPINEIINNVVWDFDYWFPIMVDGEIKVNFEGNWVEGCNGCDGYPPEYKRELTWYGSGRAQNQWYIADNWGSYRLPDDNPIKDDWLSIQGMKGADVPIGYKSSTRFTASGIPVTRTLMTPNYALEILDDVGATKPVRDSVDASSVEDFKNKMKGYVGFSEVTWPTFSSPSPPTDSDNDGMADSWETGNGLKVGTNDSMADLDGDGYINIEEYLHYLAGADGQSPPFPPANLRVVQ